MAEEADCAILLDINNIFVNAFNHRFDPLRYIDSVPPNAWSNFISPVIVTMALTCSTPTIIRFAPRFGPCTSTRCGASAGFRRYRMGRQYPEFDVLAATADEARRRCESALACSSLRHLNEHGSKSIPEFAL